METRPSAPQPDRELDPRIERIREAESFLQITVQDTSQELAKVRREGDRDLVASFEELTNASKGFLPEFVLVQDYTPAHLPPAPPPLTPSSSMDEQAIHLDYVIRKKMAKHDVPKKTYFHMPTSTWVTFNGARTKLPGSRNFPPYETLESLDYKERGKIDFNTPFKLGFWKNEYFPREYKYILFETAERIIGGLPEGERDEKGVNEAISRYFGARVDTDSKLSDVLETADPNIKRRVVQEVEALEAYFGKNRLPKYADITDEIRVGRSRIFEKWDTLLPEGYHYFFLPQERKIISAPMKKNILLRTEGPDYKSAKEEDGEGIWYAAASYRIPGSSTTLIMHLLWKMLPKYMQRGSNDQRVFHQILESEYEREHRDAGKL